MFLAHKSAESVFLFYATYAYAKLHNIKQFRNNNIPVVLLQQADSAEHRAASKLLNVFLSAKNELLQGGDGEEAEDDEESEDAENTNASMEEEVKKMHRQM